MNFVTVKSPVSVPTEDHVNDFEVLFQFLVDLHFYIVASSQFDALRPWQDFRFGRVCYKLELSSVLYNMTISTCI